MQALEEAATAPALLEAARAAKGEAAEHAVLAEEAARYAETAPDRQTAVNRGRQSAKNARAATSAFADAARTTTKLLGSAEEAEEAEEAKRMVGPAGTEAAAAGRAAADAAVALQDEEAVSEAVLITQAIEVTADLAQQAGIQVREAEAVNEQVQTALATAALEQRSRRLSSSGEGKLCSLLSMAGCMHQNTYPAKHSCSIFAHMLET